MFVKHENIVFIDLFLKYVIINRNLKTKNRMNTTGKLNLDGKVEIEFKEDAWGLLMKGHINELRHSVLIDYKEGSKAKMNVIIDQSLSSSVLESKTIAGNTL